MEGRVLAGRVVDVLTRALEDPEPLTREHTTWALAQLGKRDC